VSAKITTLINKQDSNEIVRDQIAAILAIEVANQRALAIAASLNPDDFSFSVYIEQSKPWESSEMPLVNVIFDNDRFDNKNSNTIDRQRATGTFIIDCYAHKITNDDSSGDELSSREADRIARLVRNIIMAGEYTYLCLGTREYPSGGIVSRRYIPRREKFQPDMRSEAYENIVACRLTVEVDYDEFSPQAEMLDFELLINSCERDDEKVYFSTEYDMTE
jgi:hypothetical protein